MIKCEIEVNIGLKRVKASGATYYKTPQKREIKKASMKRTPSLYSGDIQLLQKRSSLLDAGHPKSETSSICSNNLNSSFTEFTKTYLHSNVNFISNKILEKPSNDLL